MRRRLKFVLGLLSVLPVSAASKRVYEVGTVYLYFAGTPEQQIVQDLETMSRAGIEQVSLFPPFLLTPGHPEPDFSKADLAVRTAERLGMAVQPLLFFAEQLPLFAAARWPDREPPLTIPYGVRESKLSLADPEVLGLVEHYVAAAVRHFKDSPALAGWNVWTEPHFRPRPDDRNANRWFEEWLLAKYGSAQTLNQRWHAAHFDDQYASVDSVLFRWDANARILERLVKTVKSIDPVHPTRSHSVGSTVVHRGGFGDYNQNDWIASRPVDQYGFSWYPDIPGRSVEDNQAAVARALATWGAPWAESLMLTSTHDATRGKPFVLMEVQSGPRSGLTRYSFFNYQIIHRMIWQAVAHDAKAVVFWKWYPFVDGYQAFGRGLVSTDGTLTERAIAAGDASRVLNGDPGLFLDSQPVRPQVAVVYDVIGDLKAKLHGGDWGSMTARNLLGIYKVLWRDQVRVNVLEAGDLTAASLKPYRLVVFPFFMCLRKNVAEAIETYVREGGTVVADARFGIMDEWHQGYRVNPGQSMAAFFGARRHDFTADYSHADVRLTAPAAFLKGIDAPARLAGGIFREQLQLEAGSEGTVIGVFEKTGAPAIVAKRTGLGRTFLLAFSLGTPLFDGEDAGAAEFLRALVRTAGVTPPVKVTLPEGRGPVEAVVHTRGLEDERLVFLINWGDQDTEVAAELPWGGAVALEAADRVSGGAVRTERSSGRVVLRLKVPAGRAAVVHVGS